MLGKIYEETGWKGKAMEHYSKFLALWKDADPGIAEVEDAKKRLAGVQVPRSPGEDCPLLHINPKG